MAIVIGNVLGKYQLGIMVDQYGADTMRLYEMFMGDFEQAAPWQTSLTKPLFSSETGYKDKW